MAYKNTTDSFGSIAKFFHWTVSPIIIGLLILGFLMQKVTGNMHEFWYNVHKTFGIIVLFLMLSRLLWRLYNIQPAAPKDDPRMFHLLALSVHWAIYLFAIVMPLSGWISSSSSGHTPHFLGLFYWSLPGLSLNPAIASGAMEVHETVAFIVIALVSIHILAALYHHFIKRDHILRRMLPFGRST